MNPEQPILTEAERAQVLVEWNATQAEYPRDVCLHELVQAQVRRTPDAIAVFFEGQQLTYGELNRRANQLAHHLQGLGVGPDVLVGLCVERSLELVVGLLGILKAGGAYVPLDPGYPQQRLAFMLEDARVPVLLTQQRLLERLPADGAHAICLDTHWKRIARRSARSPQSGVQPEHLAYVIYTSGSTGRPKGVMNTHAGICNRLLWMQEAYHLAAEDRVLQKTPFSFDVSVWEFFWPLISGARLVLARPGGHRDSAYLVDLIAQHRITTLHFVPSMLRVLLEEHGLEACQCVKRVICSGEALPLDLQERFFVRFQAELHNLYGPTEAAVDVTYWACERGSDRQTVPIGRPIANTQIYILSESLQPVPIGEPGELHIGGTGLARGYLNRPELTAERFIPHPFSSESGTRLYKTGDLARYHSDGTIEYLGRLDDQVKLRGFRIELGEIEAVLAQHSGIQDAVVRVREDQPGDKRLVAYLVPDHERAFSVRQLLRFERAGLLTGRTPYELPNGKAIVAHNKSEVDFVYHEIFEDEAYAGHGITLRNGDCIFDVGANIGLFTLFVSRACQNSKVYAFEPIPPVCATLRLNAQLYGDDITVVNCGLSDEVGRATFTYYPHCSIISGRFADRQADQEVIKTFLQNQAAADGRSGGPADADLDALLAMRLTTEEYTCQLQTLSRVVREYGVARIDLLKIDVEKGELDVLAGIELGDWQRIRQVIVEVHDIGGRLQQVTALLERQGYTVSMREDPLLKGTGLYTIYAVRPLENDARVAAPGDETGILASNGSAYSPTWATPKQLLADVRRVACEQLPEYMIPSAYVLLDALPLTPNGKLDRNALPAPDWSRRELDATYEAPRTPTEQTLAAIWASLLGLEHVSVQDDFFELGGHSLIATQVLARVRDTFQVELSLQSLFEARTLDALAQIVEEAGRSATSQPFPPILPIARDGDLPLSFSQERVWFLLQLYPGTMAYNFQATLRMCGVLDVAALERSLGEIVRRHEIYRTTFSARHGQPAQVIHPAQSVHLPVVDVSMLPDPEAQAQQRINDEFQKRFDLMQLPLVRWTLLRLSAADHILVHVEHHLVHDGWSFNVFLRELLTIYQAYSAGKPSPLSEPIIQFADFAFWQRQWMQGEVADTQLAYWAQKLAGSPPILGLPTDHPRPAMQTFVGKTQRVELPARLAEALRVLSRRQGATLFMTMLAVFDTLLARYSLQEDICVGCGIANRRWHETEALMGMVINTVALRTDLTGNPTVAELLERVRQVTLEAYSHQDVPFGKVVEVLQPERQLGYSPIYQVAFSFHDSPMPDVALPGLSLEILEGLSNGTAKFDLNVIAIPRAEQSVGQGSGAVSTGITLIWEYNTDLFDETTMTRMLGHYQTLLEGLVAAPEQRIGELPLLTAAERHQLLVEWTATWAAYPREVSIPALFEAQVARAPDAVAVVFGEEQLTYGELNRRANQLAHHLQGLGVGPEVLVGLCVERSLDLVVGLLGILKAGGAYVPLDPTYPPERLAFMLADSQASVLLTQQRLVERLPEHRATVVCLDRDWEAIECASVEPPASEVTSANLAYVIYTSGSTGRPKGVQITHGAVLNLTCWHQRAFAIGPGDRATQVAGLGFDASVWEIWPYLAAGASIHLPDPGTRASTVQLRDWLVAQAITITFLPTPLAEQVLELEWPTDLALRTVLTGGDTLQRYPPPGLPFDLVNNYGPTENTVVTTSGRILSQEQTERRPSLGCPIANTQVYLLDAQFQPVPVGVPGEIYIGGDGLARGYLNRPDLTAERFVPHPYSAEPGERLYRTGDLARYRADGNLEFLGRMDTQVKIRGYRIELGEIEAVLSQHPAVREAVVLAREDAPGDKRLVAYVVPQPENSALISSALRRALQAQLPDYMVPSAFVLLEALPLTANGKVDRRALPAPDSGRLEVEAAYAAPRTPAEDKLAAIWSDILGLKRVGIHDNFFEVGGHSLLATRVISRVRDAFQIELPLRSLFEAPTIAGLAAVVVQRRAEQANSETLAHMLTELESLSEEEVRMLLATEQ